MPFSGKCQYSNDYVANIPKTELRIADDDLFKTTSTIDRKSDDFKAGQADAREYYTDNSAYAVSFFSSVLVPPAGLVTTVVLSTIKPKAKNLTPPNKDFLKDEQYAKGYMHEASRLKTRRAWGGFVTGVSFFGLACFMLYR